MSPKVYLKYDEEYSIHVVNGDSLRFLIAHALRNLSHNIAEHGGGFTRGAGAYLLEFIHLLFTSAQYIDNCYRLGGRDSCLLHH